MSDRLKKRREDFPVLEQASGGKPPIYFDNACMSLKPRQVIEAMNEYYFNYPGCHKRSAHRFGRMTTERYIKARQAVQKFINAASPDEIIFTKNTTEAINLIARAFPFRKGDIILTTEAEHNSNLLPWQALRDRAEVVHKTFSLRDDFTFDAEVFTRALGEGVRLVSIFHTSHITGYTLPVKEIVELSHRHGALVMLDGAQGVAHQKIDIQALGADFFAFSFHKMLGPTGMGALYVNRELADDIPPFIIGGETIEDADYESFTLSQTPDKFEAGLQNYAGAIGAEAAINYLEEVGLEDIREHESHLNEMITSKLLNSSKVRLLGPRDSKLRAGIINFYILGLDSGELSVILDRAENIMVRSGVHCSHPLYNRYQIPPTLRASLYFYNTREEAETFITTIEKIIKYF